MNLLSFEEFHSPVRESSFRVNLSYRNLVILNLLHQHYQISEENVLQRIVELMACTWNPIDDEGADMPFIEVIEERSMTISVPVPVLGRLILALDTNPDYQGKTASEQVSSIVEMFLTYVGNSYFELRDLNMTNSEIFNNITSNLVGESGCEWL